jgi:hypothetical protein
MNKLLFPAKLQAKADWLYELLRDYQSASVDICTANCLAPAVLEVALDQ